MVIRQLLSPVLFSFLIGLMFNTSVKADDVLGENTFDKAVYTAYPWGLRAKKEDAVFRFENGHMVVAVKGATKNPWDIRLWHKGIRFVKGRTYTLRFKVKATRDTKLQVNATSQWPGKTQYWTNSGKVYELLKGQYLTVKTSFTVDEDVVDDAQLSFSLGGDLSARTPVEYHFDYVYLDDPKFTRAPQAPELAMPIIRLNQVGYHQNSRKRAVVVHSSTHALIWQLKDKSGHSVARGKTTVFGYDKASGDHVHHIEFSPYSQAGEGYRLKVNHNGVAYGSHPFTISDTIYSQLRYDALNYFYHNRSGSPVKLPYAGRKDITRKAMHATDVMRTWPNSGQQDYALNLTKGWYDAGDTGKYATPGGGALWVMMNIYERNLHAAGTKKNAYADGSMQIPENTNGYPDILDEARYEMDMLLGMQVPKGYQYAGMVHHKGHNFGKDGSKRYLAPVSTTATLHIAATAAQSARVWLPYDKAYSQRCLTAAERAWDAVRSNKVILAKEGFPGGGGYGDKHVDDEFYWAACELYVTTGKAKYLNYLQSSKFYLNKTASGYAPITVSWLDKCGTVSLALVPNKLPKAEIQKARKAVQAWADVYLAAIETEGYLVGLSIKKAHYTWGSNSLVLRQAIAMGLAFDFTQDERYYHGVVEQMNYLLGKNGLDQSYIAGYGERPVKNLFHYFWTRKGGLPPAGAISLGPNQGFMDHTVQDHLMRTTPPQKCFMDHNQSYSTNEVMITCNALLSWSAAFLDDKVQGN